MIKYLIVLIVSVASLSSLKGQDTSMLELPKHQVEAFKAEVQSLSSNWTSKIYTSKYQALVDVVYLGTNDSIKAREKLKNITATADIENKYKKYSVIEDQICFFEETHDTLRGRAIEAVVLPLNLMFGQIVKCWGDEVLELKSNRFWLLSIRKAVKTRHSDKDELDYQVIGIFIKSLPDKKILPDRLQECVNYYSALTVNTPSYDNRKFAIDPIRVNIDTLTLDEKREVLNEALNTKISSFCGYDNTAINQELLIYRLSAELGEWGIFIKALMNIVSDNVSRAVDDTRSNTVRDKYYYNISKLDIDPWLFLLGQAINYSDTSKTELSIPPILIPALLFDENLEIYFNEIIELVTSEQLDYFNRYSLLLLARKYLSYSRDENEYKRFVESLEKSISSFPESMQNILCQRMFGHNYPNCE